MRPGKGFASRVNSAVRAQTARKASGTMNLRMSRSMRRVLDRPGPASDGRGRAMGQELFEVDCVRALPVPAMVDRISVSAWMFRS
jgi:hypothetical protein